MRWFTLFMSIVLVVVGVGMIVDGDSSGWLVAGSFALCLLVAVFEPRLTRFVRHREYWLVITDAEIACEHLKRQRESIRWEEVNRIWYVTTSDGPRIPDEWILLEGEQGGCSFPTEVAGMDAFWDELKQRFPGFDYGPLIRGGTEDAKQLCWERRRMVADG